MKLFSITVAIALIAVGSFAYAMKKNVHPDGNDPTVIITDEKAPPTPRSSWGHDDDDKMRTKDPIQFPNPKEELEPTKQTPPTPPSLPSQ